MVSGRSRCIIFFFVFGGVGGGGLFFPRSRFIKAIISIHIYIVRSSSPEGAGVSFFFGGGGGGDYFSPGAGLLKQ